MPTVRVGPSDHAIKLIMSEVVAPTTSGTVNTDAVRKVLCSIFEDELMKAFEIGIAIGLQKCEVDEE